MEAVSDELRGRLVRMARFRNLVVHLYWKVEDAEIYRVILEDLQDFDRDLASIGRYLRTELWAESFRPSLRSAW